MKKRILIAILAVICVVSCILLVACDNTQEVLDTRLIIQQDGKAVSGPFTLPRYIGENKDYEVAWKADKEDFLSLTQQTETYLATPIPGDTRETVTLTASIGRSTKEFTVIVKAINAFYFLEKYEFEYSGRNVYESFDVPTELVENGRTAQLTWKINSQEEEVAEMGAIDEEAKTQRVNVTVVPGKDIKVKINATINYKEEDPLDMEYSFIVTEYKEHGAEVAQWYDTEKGTIDIKGYVVGVAEPYSTFGNASIYAMDEDGCHAFYLYRIKMDASDGEKLEPGVHFTATGISASPYNGLMEGSGGNLVINGTPLENVDNLAYDLDNDIIGNVPQVKYMTGGLVSLTNWKAKYNGDKPTSYSSTTVLTLENGGVTVAVATSTAMKGFYSSKDDEAFTGIANAVGAIKKDDYVSVTGILTYYNGWQILPRSADDIKAGTQAAAPTEGTTVAKAIAEVNSFLITNGLSKNSLVVTDKSVVLPTTSSDNAVTISWKICAVRQTIRFDDAESRLNITLDSSIPDKEEAYLEATYVVGNYVTRTYHLISAQSLTDAKVVEKIGLNIDNEILKTFERNATVNLPTVTTAFGTAITNVTISWALKDTSDWASVSNNVLTVGLPSSASQATLIATISYGTASDDVEVVINHIGGAEGMVARFTFGDKGPASHVDGDRVNANDTIDTDGSYTLKFTAVTQVYKNAFDANGNSCIKLGSSSVAGTFTFTVPSNITEVKIYVAGYKNNSASVSINDGTAQSLTNISNDGIYDIITVDTSTNKTVIFTVASGPRVMINTIEWFAK